MTSTNSMNTQVQEQFYPVTSAIFKVLPKSRPPFAFYFYDNSVSDYTAVSKPGKVLLSTEKERIKKACESGHIYIHSNDIPATIPYISSHLKLVLKDMAAHMAAVDLAPVLLSSMKTLIAPLFKESVKLNFDKFNEVVQPLLMTLEKSPDILRLIIGMLDKEHTLTNKAVATGFTGLGVCMLGRDTKTDMQTLTYCAYALFLCDIGLCRLPDFVLGKEFCLTIDEQKRIKHHPILTLEILTSTKAIPKPALVAILEHHERLDGSGYPRGIKGDSISWIGKLCGVVDSYVAMVMDRPGKKSMSEVNALKTLYKESSMYDPNIVYALEKVILRD